MFEPFTFFPLKLLVSPTMNLGILWAAKDPTGGSANVMSMSMPVYGILNLNRRSANVQSIVLLVPKYTMHINLKQVFYKKTHSLPFHCLTDQTFHVLGQIYDYQNYFYLLNVIIRSKIIF